MTTRPLPDWFFDEAVRVYFFLGTWTTVLPSHKVRLIPDEIQPGLCMRHELACDTLGHPHPPPINVKVHADNRRLPSPLYLRREHVFLSLADAQAAYEAVLAEHAMDLLAQ